MTIVKLKDTGGYKDLEAAVGKEFNATRFLGHWNIAGVDLAEAGATPHMAEYAFLTSEVEIVHGFCKHSH